ncbi:hypothetical protein AJ78_01838 [Emergomyces pasteurianus Ep9510]|uniref:Uncharacterized protein n=1 Tax=Emergomyces pasteurianus Ep9510 TaxID=1447872 RepID=A0A1J9PNR5_9EURO|nr:hypothetical protein AJ78_01838 [Emergomyces pasteurianus Ep9510]
MDTILRVPQEPTMRNGSSTTSASSGRSNHSHSTCQTAYSHQPVLIVPGKGSLQDAVDGRESTDTYTSTLLSEAEEDVSNEIPIELVADRYEDFPSNAIPSSPPSFGELFPSTRRLLIRHDDTTIDGNMNLRIDTIAPQPGGRQCEIILFHLRMHDLRNRKFSLRRYCRDSGREVCHSTRKFHYPSAEMLTALQRPLTNAFSTLRSKSDSISPTTSGLWRQDSGYKSASEYPETADSRRYSIGALSRSKSPEPTNTIQLEFSNYAHVDVKRRGPRGSKHYDFEYWSTRYQWKRTSRKDGDSKEISFDLYHTAKSKPVAHISPEPLTPLEALEEKSKGGWVPPCSLWISDPSLYESMKDVADVIVATGLIALVDDSIKRRWNSKRSSHSHSPMTSSFMKSMDSVASNKIMEKVFHRRGSTGSRHNSFRQMFAHA